MTSLRLLGEEEFERHLSDFARPAKAVTKIQHLHGRADSLKRARKALRSEGSQAFIFGERGVGKTSLAKTALAEICPEHASDLLVACEKNSTFVSIMLAVAKRLMPICQKTAKKTEIKAAFSGFGLSFEVSQLWETDPPIELRDLNSFILLVKAIDKVLPSKIAVIIDEFDLIVDTDERMRFADFVKQLSDQDVRLKFVFCGIATDIDSLIGSHFSAGRYIEPIELGPLKPGDNFSILQAACDAFDVEVDKEILYRAALIADGYPYFMHLVAQHALEAIYEDKNAKLEITAKIFDEAVRRSVDRAEPMLRVAYDTATKKYHNTYETILWAVATPTVFENKWDDIYDRCYSSMPMPEANRLSRDNFCKRILNLTREEYGCILETNSNGWYKFRESVVRSYVRLRATQSGVSIGIDLHGQPGKFRTDLGVR
jgi:hypothetical protein